jgi:cell division protein FtsB
MSDPQRPDAHAAAVDSSRPRRPLKTSFEIRERRRRLVNYGLIGLAVALLVDAMVGENGYLAGVRAGRARTALAVEVSHLKSDNDDLRDQARRLQGDPDAVEEAARREMGLIRPGETLVIVKGGKPAGQ